MFARFTIVQVNVDTVDEVIKLYEDSVVPAAKSQKGYRGANLFTDRKTGKGYSITLHEIQETRPQGNEISAARAVNQEFWNRCKWLENREFLVL